MARRITYRFLVFGSLVLALVLLILHTSSYGLSREAQFDAMHKKLGGWSSGSGGGGGVGGGGGGRGSAGEVMQDELQTEHFEAKYAGQKPPATEPPASPPPPSSPLPITIYPPKPSPETTSPQNQTHTRALVIARTISEIPLTSWLDDPSLRDDPFLTIHPYTVDAPLTTSPASTSTTTTDTVPANKGHEAMPYLTYIITHYSSPTLATITLFMHAHRYTWHNNDLLDSDSLSILTHLSTPTVLRRGYFNLRCHLDPGCPAHLYPATKEFNINRPEEREIGAAWASLFPGEPVPAVLSQPCCSQFALSADKIRSIPLETYERLRQWLLDTPLDDALAGRVFEYVWQKLWLGLDEWCPEEHICYCDGYGICFGGKEPYEHWFDMRKELRVLAPKLEALQAKDRERPGEGILETEGAAELSGRVAALRREMEADRREAFGRGMLARNRAVEAGRGWEEGDGF